MRRSSPAPPRAAAAPPHHAPPQPRHAPPQPRSVPPLPPIPGTNGSGGIPTASHATSAVVVEQRHHRGRGHARGCRGQCSHGPELASSPVRGRRRPRACPGSRIPRVCPWRWGRGHGARQAHLLPEHLAPHPQMAQFDWVCHAVRQGVQCGSAVPEYLWVLHHGGKYGQNESRGGHLVLARLLPQQTVSEVLHHGSCVVCWRALCVRLRFGAPGRAASLFCSRTIYLKCRCSSVLVWQPLFGCQAICSSPAGRVVVPLCAVVTQRGLYCIFLSEFVSAKLQ